MINTLVYSGVLVPGVIFTGLLLVPWIERRFSKDDREHHLLDRPRDAPHRTAAGAASISFVAVLFLGGAQDVIATTLRMSIGHVTAVLQIAAIVLPPIAYVATLRLCRSLKSRPGADRTERAGGGRARRRRRLPRGDRARGRAGRRAGGCGWWRVSEPTRAGLAPPLTEQAQDIESIWNGMLVAAFVVGVLVIALIAYVVVRYRRRPGPLPFQRHEHVRLEVTYMVVPLLVVVRSSA